MWKSPLDGQSGLPLPNGFERSISSKGTVSEHIKDASVVRLLPIICVREALFTCVSYSDFRHDNLSFCVYFLMLQMDCIIN